MSTSHESMIAELKSTVIPHLRSSGFKGSFPHFRRPGSHGIDLLTFQFDQHGGGFVIEIARVPAAGITTYWEKVIPPQRVSAWDVHPDERKRILPGSGSGTDSWFRFDKSQFAQCAMQVIKLLPEAEQWWSAAQAAKSEDKTNGLP